jgi:hypothetical protein
VQKSSVLPQQRHQPSKLASLILTEKYRHMDNQIGSFSLEKIHFIPHSRVKNVIIVQDKKTLKTDTKTNFSVGGITSLFLKLNFILRTFNVHCNKNNFTQYLKVNEKETKKHFMLSTYIYHDELFLRKW